MKRWLALVLNIALILFGSPSGELYSYALGYGGGVGVFVKLEGNTIADVRVVCSSESAGIGDLAAQEAARRIVLQQSLTPDAVSSGTVSSSAVYTAAQRALRNENIELAEIELPPAKDFVCDVLIIGADAAGLCAAVQLARGGISVMVAESAGIAGGADSYSTGTLKNSEITPEIAEFLDSCGLQLLPVGEISVMYGESKSGGGAVTLALLRTAEALGVQFIYETTAAGILVDPQRGVHGALLVGNSSLVRADADTVLLCGSGILPAESLLQTPAALLGQQVGAQVSQGRRWIIQSSGLYWAADTKEQQLLCGQLLVDGEGAVLRENTSRVKGLYAAGAAVFQREAQSVEWSEYLTEQLLSGLRAASGVLAGISSRD